MDFRPFSSIRRLNPERPPPVTTSPTVTHRADSLPSNPQTTRTELTVPDATPAPAGEQKALSAPDLRVLNSNHAYEAEEWTLSPPPPVDTPLHPEPAAAEVLEISRSNEATASQLPVSVLSSEYATADADVSRHSTDGLSSVLQALAGLVQLRDQLLLAQSALEQERQKAAAAQSFLEQSQSDLVRILQAGVSSGDSGYGLQQISTAYEQSSADLAVYREQSSLVKGMEAVFKNQEFALLAEDHELVRLIGYHFPDLQRPRVQTPNQNIPVDVRAMKRSPAASPAPSTLQAYWEALGEEEALRDELFDLDAEYRYEAAEIERIIEHDEALSSPASEFEREFEYKRNSLTAQISLTEEKAQQLREECVAKGINTSAPRKTTSPSSTPPLPASEAVTLPNGDIPSDLRMVVGLAKSEPTFQQFRNVVVGNERSSSDHDFASSMQERIASWLAEIEHRSSVGNANPEQTHSAQSIQKCFDPGSP